MVSPQVPVPLVQPARLALPALLVRQVRQVRLVQLGRLVPLVQLGRLGQIQQLPGLLVQPDPLAQQGRPDRPVRLVLSNPSWPVRTSQ